MCRLTCSHFHIGSRASSVSRHFHPIHGHAHCCLSVLFLLTFYFVLDFTFLLFLLFTMTDSDSMNNPLCHSVIGSIVSLDNCTPDTGYEPNVMELTGTTELNNAVLATSTSRIPSTTQPLRQTSTWMTTLSASFSQKYTEITPITAVRKV